MLKEGFRKLFEKDIIYEEKHLARKTFMKETSYEI